MYEPSPRKTFACSGGTTADVSPARGTDSTSFPVCSAALMVRIAVAASANGYTVCSGTGSTLSPTSS